MVTSYRAFVLFYFLCEYLASLGELHSTRVMLEAVLDEKLKPMEFSMNVIISELLDPWENIKTNSSSVDDVSAPTADALRKFYHMKGDHCMILGKLLAQNSVANIQRAHIWPKHTFGKGLNIFDLEQEAVSNVRNYLLMQAELEYYFDRKKFILVPVASSTGSASSSSSSVTYSFKVVVLYSDLLKSNIVFKPHSGTRKLEIPWSQINGMKLTHQFKDSSKPFTRLIAQHCFSSMKKAKRCGAVDDVFCSSFHESVCNLARRSLDEKHFTGFLGFNKVAK